MPNHCEVQLQVTGDPEKVKTWMKRHVVHRPHPDDPDYIREKPELTFETAVPMPHELRGTPVPCHDAEERQAEAERAERHGHGNWYDWRIHNWGTKWDAYECRVGDDNLHRGVLEVTFCTAWSPPVEWFEVMAMETPWLTYHMSWQEHGVGLYGSVSHEGKAQ